MLRYLTGLLLVSVPWFGCGSKTAERTTIQAESLPNDGVPEAYVPDDRAEPIRPPYVQSELNQIRNTLDTIALDLSCSVDEHCVALAADDNACGIPLEWLIFSTQAPRYNEVKKLLERSFYLDNTYPNSRFTVCGGPTKPKLQCSSGQCNVLPPAP